MGAGSDCCSPGATRLGRSRVKRMSRHWAALRTHCVMYVRLEDSRKREVAKQATWATTSAASSHLSRDCGLAKEEMGGRSSTRCLGCSWTALP